MSEYKMFGLVGTYVQLLLLWLWFWGFLTNWWVILSPMVFSISLHLFIVSIAFTAVTVIYLFRQLRKLNARKH